MSGSSCNSRSFLGAYTENEIVKPNPFTSINQTGVGQLRKIACEKGNATRPGNKLGPATCGTANTTATPIP